MLIMKWLLRCYVRPFQSDPEQDVIEEDITRNKNGDNHGGNEMRESALTAPVCQP